MHTQLRHRQSDTLQLQGTRSERLPAGSSSESGMSRPSAFMVSTFPPPLAGKGQILRLQREPPTLLAPPTPQGAVLVPPPTGPCIPAGTRSQSNRDPETQTHINRRHIQTHVHTRPTVQTRTHTRHTQMHNFRQRCAHKRAQTYSHRILANTEEKPKQRMKPPWQGWEALQRRLGGERGRRGSVRPQYKAGILGMEMLPPLLRPLSPASRSISPFTGLHERSLQSSHIP